MPEQDFEQRFVDKFDEEDETEQYPFDPTPYAMGAFIPADVIERAYGIPREKKEEYWKKILHAQQFMERFWLGKYGIHVAIVSKNDGLRICLDEEAVDVIEARQKKALKSFRKGHRILLDVNDAKLTTDQKSHRMRRLVRGAGLLAFLNKRTPPRLKKPDGLAVVEPPEASAKKAALVEKALGTGYKKRSAPPRVDDR